MYPQRTLTDLARRKLRLREAIAVRRAYVADAASVGLEPLRWLDLAGVIWARISPLAKAAVGLPAARLPRQNWMVRLRRWLPVTLAALRLLRVLRTEGRWWIAGTMC